MPHYPSERMEEIIAVEASKSYDILIGRGLLSELGALSGAVVSPCRAMLVTDDIVDPLYAKTALASLTEAGFTVEKFVFPHGEASKTTETYLKLLNACADAGLSRTDVLIALGGGVVGDLTGFAAATYLRGIRFIQVPTTLLAAVDSSVGGKTGVDLPAGKNLIGAFWQPSLVVCDYALLDTLTEDIFRDGCAEVIKYAVIHDPALFETLKKPIRPILGEVISACVRHKRDIVKEDERDTGARQLLNLGHTFGHAIEALSDFTISHGSAVAIGMNLVSVLAHRQGLLSKEDLEEIQRLLLSYGLPIHCPFSAEKIVGIAFSDKKRSGDKITLVIPHAIGHTELHKIPFAELLPMLGSILSEGGRSVCI